MSQYDERPMTEDERLRAGYALLSSPDFRVISDFLYGLEQEAVRALRDDLGSPQDHILTIRTVNRFRQHIRALAELTGVREDPIRREV